MFYQNQPQISPPTFPRRQARLLFKMSVGFSYDFRMKFSIEVTYNFNKIIIQVKNRTLKLKNHKLHTETLFSISYIFTLAALIEKFVHTIYNNILMFFTDCII